MDSLPQEIIDEIIDNLPLSSLRSSSLVARRWRTRSQQRVLRKIGFRSESMVHHWYMDIKSNLGGVSSYVQSVGFRDIIEWRDPELFGLVLRRFTSLTTLEISDTEIPEEMLEHRLHGEKVTTLYLRSLRRCSLSTMISTIFAFPNLRDLAIVDLEISWGGRSPACTVLSPRRPLRSLLVRGRGSGTVAEALADHRFTSRCLTLDAQPQNIQKLLIHTSVTIVELVLVDNPNQWISSHPIGLPPFPALTSLRIYFPRGTPTVHLIDILSSISSVPALSSITLGRWMRFTFEPDYASTWDHLDAWLVQTGRNATVEGDLVLALTSWRRDRVPEVLLPRFREVGKFTTAVPLA